MKEKMTVDQFNAILVDLEQMKDSPAAHMGVSIVAGYTALDMDYMSEIPSYMKASLCRKVLRYVAKTALKGTMEIDGLASSCSFCAMENGHAISFGSNVEWSFNHKGELINVTIDSKSKEVYYYDKYFKELYHCEIPYGVHWTQVTGRIDLIGIFEHWDLVARR